MSETVDMELVAAETLSGDLRDVLLTHIRSMETPWSKMSEQAQSDKIYAISNASETIVRRAVAIIAARGVEPIFGRIAKFTVKDEIKAELVASSSVANIEAIAENIGQAAIIIFANPEVFLGEKAPATAEKDQPELPIDADDLDDGATHDNNTAPSATDDELYEKAVAAIRLSGKASTSFVQRTLQVGYNVAARLVDRMEKEGVVSAATTAGKREVLTGSQTEAA